MPAAHTKLRLAALALTIAAIAGTTGALSPIPAGANAPTTAPAIALAPRAAATAHPSALVGPIPRQDVWIVQAADIDTARDAVLRAGGTLVRELAIVNAVGAHLPGEALARIRANDAVHTFANTGMSTASRATGTTKPAKGKRTTRLASAWTNATTSSPDAPSSSDVSSTKTIASTDTSLVANEPAGSTQVNVATADIDNVRYPALVAADTELAAGIDGTGVTVAILDTGFKQVDGLQHDRHHESRVLANFDAINNVLGGKNNDGYGHGTHVAGVIANSVQARDGSQTGIAPNARLVNVKAFGDDGSATYLDVLTGMQWLLDHRATYGIRVLNLSFSAAPASHYWDDPVNQAVMKLWQAGIVVVAAAGNDGPVARTVGVPGNTPYVITVGAMTDNYTLDPTDDRMASFSSAGPTHEGFVKPDVMAPGGHIVSLMDASSAQIAQAHPEFQVDGNYFRMSGTSQATAVVSGVVALLLQKKPWLTPDDVKCQLMSSAGQAVDGAGNLVYSVFQQGAGLVNAQRAVASTAAACANRGLDIAADIAGTAHFGGYAQLDADGNYYLMGIDGYLWSRTDLFASGFLWSRSTLDGASLWSSGTLYSNGYLWSRSLAWDDTLSTSGSSVTGFLWSRSTGVNRWTPQE